MVPENKKGKVDMNLTAPSETMEIEQDSTIFDSIIGQSECCKQLSMLVNSHSLETPFPTLLFSGSQGLGKTYMAQKVASALGRELVEINCGSIKTTSDLMNVLINRVAGETPKTILFDESQELQDEVSESLKTLLAPNEDLSNTFNYKSYTFQYDFRKYNVIFATTDAYKMERALVNRCKKLYFHLYEKADLIKILNHYLPSTFFSCDQTALSYACRGRARDTFFLSQDIKRYCNLRKTSTITESGWKEFQEIFGIYPYGLKSEEVELLKILEKCEPCSIHSLAVKMGVKEKNIELELEVRLRELGFIDNTARGRILTEDGKAYLKGTLKIS